MQLLEFMLSMSSMSILGLILAQVLNVQQIFLHKVKEQVQQVYAVMLIAEQFNNIERELSAICSAFPLHKTGQSLVAFGQVFFHYEHEKFTYYTLLDDVEWFETKKVFLGACLPHMKVFFSNLQQGEAFVVDDCSHFSPFLDLSLQPPMMRLRLIARHMDLHEHKLRVYQQGRPQTLAGGFSNLDVRVLNQGQIQWKLRFPNWPELTWVSKVCKN